MALGALEQLYRHTQRWRELLDVYEKKRELVYDPAERKPILHEIAKLYETELRDPKAAIETYRAMLEDDAADAPALAAAVRSVLTEREVDLLPLPDAAT